MSLQKNQNLEFWLNVLIFGGLLLALLLNLGVNAVYLEEPRRAMVGLEMQLNDNYFVPTYYGEFYYRKPPIFNWALLGSFKIFGVTEFAARFVTVLSMLLWGGVNYLFVRKYSTEKLARFSSLFLTCSAILLFLMSFLAEIDVFYSLVSYSGIIVIYHFYKANKPYWMYIAVYGIGAIGLLTKGLPSIPFIALTVGAFTLWKRNWKQVFSLAHLSGILVFVVIFGGYLLIYSQYNSLLGYWDGVWGEASGRTMIKQSWLRLARHLVEFPLATLLDVAPAGLFALFALRRGAIKRLFSDELMAFCGVIWLANFLVYWVSPGAKGVYVIMLDPFLVILCVQLYLNEASQIKWMPKLMVGFAALCLGAVTLAMMVLPFVPYFAPIEGFLWQAIIFTAAMVGVWFLWSRTREQHLTWLVIAVLIGRIAFNIIVLPMREWDGRHGRFKKDALEIVRLSGDDSVKIWLPKDEGAFAHHFAFYIERGKQEVLRWTEEPNCEDYFLGLERDLAPDRVAVTYKFRNWNHDYIMFRFTDCD